MSDFDVIEVEFEDGGKFTLSSERAAKRLILDFFTALDTLEMIASFSPGKAGDEAARALTKLGVWTTMTNMETGEVLNADTTDKRVPREGARSDGCRNLFIERAGHRGEDLPEHHQPARRAGRPRPRRS